MTPKHFLSLALLALLPLTLAAQIPQMPQGGRPGGGGQFNAAQFNIGRFYGKVLDENKKPLAYASVQLLGMRFDTVSRKMEEAILAGQLTRENGEFSLENLPIRGQFTLKINYMGYATYEQKIAFDVKMPTGNGGGFASAAASVDKDLGNIILQTSSQVLKEVTVSAEASQFTLALDKKVYRPDKDGVAAGGTAEDVLKNIPSLNVDLDGNLTLRNAAPQLFVDGRPTPLTIDQIPADAIETIEVITNPSAKYDASGGNAGIVNIVLKKERRIGYNGNLRAGLDMRGRVNLGGDINAREGKFNAFIGANLNQRRSLSSGATARQNLFGNPLTDVFQANNTENTGYFGMLRGGVDWFINNRNTFTVSATLNRGEFNSFDDQTIRTDTIYDSYFVSTQALRETDNKRNFRNLGSQALYKYLFPKSGKEWTADVNFNRSKSGSAGQFLTSFLDFVPPLTARQSQTIDGSNEFFTAQTDFTDPLNDKMKIEAGARAAIRNFRSNNKTFREEVQVPGFADNYKFNDQVYAAYTNFAHSFPKWGYQVGLRAESSVYTGTLIDLDTSFTNEYPLSLFPSVFVTYKLNDQDNLQLNYSRRINRPNFFQLIPFPDFSDSLQISLGNPALRPEFTNSLEMSYQKVFSKGHNLLTSIYYKRSNDLITRYQYTDFSQELQREVVVSSFANSNSSTAYGLEFTLKNTLGKRLELTSNWNFYNAIIDASNVEANLKNEQFTWFVKENLNIKLPENFTVQFSGSYQSRTALTVGGGGRGFGGWMGGPTNTAQGYSIPVWFVDFSVRKDLWNRKATLTLNVQDIFRSRKQGTFTESDLFIQDTWRRRDPQLARLNFSYRFGKFDTSLFRRKNTRIEMDGMDAGF
ncbi:MAG: TonB-dependent receptor [Saprospiraceae bacterium]|nr:TonB-dependent receptor [Saprospiraceae bacterium]